MKAMAYDRLAGLALWVVLAGCATTPAPEPTTAGGETGSAEASPEGDATEASDASPAQAPAAPGEGSGDGREQMGKQSADVLQPLPGDADPAREPMPPAPAPVSLGSAPGAILALMPASCRTRIYVNVGALLGGDAALVSTALDQVAKAVTDANDDAAAALRGLRDAGLDPALAVRELAICDNPDIAVVRLAPTKPADLMAAIQSSLRVLGERPGTVGRWGAMRMWTSPPSDDMVLEVAPNLVMIADEPREAADALGARTGAGGFQGAGQQLVWVQDREADLVVSEKAGSFDLQFAVHQRGGAPDQAAQGKLVADIRKDLQKAAEQLAKTPLSSLGPKLRAARVTPSGSDVLVKVAISRAELSKLLKTLSSLGPADLAKLLGGL